VKFILAVTFLFPPENVRNDSLPDVYRDSRSRAFTGNYLGADPRCTHQPILSRR